MNPPPNDNNNYPQSELDILEGMFNHMFNGTMTMLFKTMQDPTFVEIVDPNTVFNTTATTTESNFRNAITDLDGSDFRHIAQKRRQKMIDNNDENDNNKNQPTTSINNNNNNNNNQLPPPPQQQQQVNDHGLHNVISIFNRDHQLENNNIHQDIFSTLFGIPNQSNNDNQENGWTFSSSSMSSQKQIHPDGTEETVTTTKRNGITETVTRIKYPDGSIEETKHVGGSGNNKNNNNVINSPGLISSPSSSSVFITSNNSPNNIDTTTPSNPLSRFFKSIWG